nr:hypothetical protein [Desulfobulbaceae bacterium]
MKAKITFLLLGLGTATYLASASIVSAAATYASSSAAINWSSLQVQSPGADITWYTNDIATQGSSSEAAFNYSWQDTWATLSGADNHSFQETLGYGSSSAVVPVSGAADQSASALADASRLLASAAAMSDDDSAYSAAAEARRWGMFWINSGGLVTISFDYDLSVQVATSATGDAYARALAAGVLHYNSGLDGAQWQSEELIITTDSSESKNGTLTLSYQFTPGSYGFLEAGARTEISVDNLSGNLQPVPLPGGLALLFTGLISCVAVAPKKKNESVVAG